MDISFGVLVAFLAMVCWGIGDFLIQRCVRKIGVVETLTTIGVIGGIGLLPFVWNDLQQLFLPENSTLLVGLGIVAFIASILNFYAYKVGKLSVVEFILEFELPVTVVLGLLLFQEVLGVEQIILMSVVFLGILLVATGTLSFKKEHWAEKGVLVALMAALLMGIVNFLTASAAKSITPLIAIWGPWMIITIISILIMWKEGKFNVFWKNVQKYPQLIAITGFVDTLAWISFAVATFYQSLSLSIAITESYPAVALLLGIHFNHEHMKGHQLLGALLALSGSVALGFWVQ
ncbi:MAG: DMT family transporter [Candidatus Diapherotrites archaeon]